MTKEELIGKQFKTVNDDTIYTILDDDKPTRVGMSWVEDDGGTVVSHNLYNVAEVNTYIADGTWLFTDEVVDYKQVDPKTVKFTFKDMKINVKTAEESRWVQEVAFANGIMWGSGQAEIKYLQCRALFFDRYGISKTDDAGDFFKNNGNKEITIQDILSSNKMTKQKEIIGYETVVDLPGIPKGTKGTQWYDNSDHFEEGGTLFLKFDGVNTWNGFDIVQLVDTKFFKPIYKSDAIELKFSKYTATLSKEHGLVFTDGEKMTYGTLRLVLNNINDTLKPLKLSGVGFTYEVTIKKQLAEVLVGCKSFTPADVKLVSDAVIKLQ